MNLERQRGITFHGFGDRIIRENYQELGFTEPPRLIDEVEKSKIVAKLLKEITVTGLDYRNFKANLPYVKGALTTAKTVFSLIKKNRLSRGDESRLPKLMQDYDLYIKNSAAAVELFQPDSHEPDLRFRFSDLP